MKMLEIFPFDLRGGGKLSARVPNILFEPNTPEILKEDIEEVIINAVDSWLPYILIKEIIISESPDDIDRNILKINIKFSLRDDLENFDEVFISVNETFGLVNSNGENQS